MLSKKATRRVASGVSERTPLLSRPDRGTILHMGSHRFQAALLFLVLAAGAFAQTHIEGQVSRVIDGDTVVVETAGDTTTIRLNGIDAPESDQPFGAEATRMLEELIAGRVVRIDVLDTDRYGRLIGEIAAGGRRVNAEIVRAGGAWWYREYATDDTELEIAEVYARAMSAGLWAANEQPIPPWEWRQGVRSPTPSAAGCDPSYPGVCIPSPPPDLDCGEITARRFRVVGPDVHRFDGDRDGIGCES